jgi:hypothetical protein
VGSACGVARLEYPTELRSDLVAVGRVAFESRPGASTVADTLKGRDSVPIPASELSDDEPHFE